MFILKVFIAALAVNQILAGSASAPADIAAKVANDYNTLTSTTQKSMNDQVDTLIAAIKTAYHNDSDPYNSIVRLLNAFTASIYANLQKYDASITDIVDNGVSQVKENLSTYTNTNDIFPKIQVAQTQIHDAVSNLAYEVASAFLAASNKLTDIMKENNNGRDSFDIDTPLAAIKSDGNIIFNTDVGKVVGDNTNGLTYLDNSIASLTIKKPSHGCFLFGCVAKAAGKAITAFSNLF